MSKTELLDFLEKASSPNHNIFLWKLLKPEALLLLTFNESNKVNENVVKNCSKSQIDEILKQITDAN